MRNGCTPGGGVVVTTEDATVYADQLAYDEKTDEALFTGGVKVVFDDGTLRGGEKFLMVMEKVSCVSSAPFRANLK